MTTKHDCIMCRIGAGGIPSHRIHESATITAFLDIHPIRAGHLLIVPRDHYEYFDAVPLAIATEIVALGQKLAPELRRLSGAERIGFFFTGVDLPHAHAHVVPLVEKTDVTSRAYIVEDKLTLKVPPRATDDDLAAMAKTLRRLIETP